MSQGISFDIYPSDYLLGTFNSKVCYLGIDKLEDIPFIILGDIFLVHHFVLFDKTKSSVGFINNHKKLTLFIKNSFIVTTLSWMCYFIIILIASILFCKGKKQNTLLTEPLRLN